MKTLFTAFVLVTGFFICSFSLMAQGQQHAGHQQEGGHKMINPKEFQWQEGPESLPKGVKIVVLEGDPNKEGPFTMRAEMPANYKIPPHWHPAIEHVTVLKGSFYMGTGEKIDMNKATMISEGGFAVMPAKFVHYAFTKGAATLQLHGIGPWGITYVNKADDPRNKPK